MSNHLRTQDVDDCGQALPCPCSPPIPAQEGPKYTRVVKGEHTIPQVESGQDTGEVLDIVLGGIQAYT